MKVYSQRALDYKEFIIGQNYHLDKPFAFQIHPYHYSHMFIQSSDLKHVTKEGSTAFLSYQAHYLKN